MRGGRPIEAAEEQRLRRDIGVACAVIIKMFVRDIGHCRNVEIHRGDATLVQPVAGAFDHGIGAAGVDHLAQETLHLRRVGRGDVEAGVDLSAADAGAHGGDDADATLRRCRRCAGRLENRLEQRACRRLAVGAGDAYDDQIPAWKVLQRSRTGGEGKTAVGCFDVGGAGLKRTVGSFLRGLWRDGALFGAAEAQAFYVKCDSETNPPESIDLGRVVVEVGIAPVKPAEFVIFRIAQIKETSA